MVGAGRHVLQPGGVPAGEDPSRAHRDFFPDTLQTLAGTSGRKWPRPHAPSICLCGERLALPASHQPALRTELGVRALTPRPSDTAETTGPAAGRGRGGQTERRERSGRETTPCDTVTAVCQGTRPGRRRAPREHGTLPEAPDSSRHASTSSGVQSNSPNGWRAAREPSVTRPARGERGTREPAAAHVRFFSPPKSPLEQERVRETQTFLKRP